MANSADFLKRLDFLFLPLGPVERRPWFGAHLYKLEGRPFAFAYGDQLYLKCDEESRPFYEARASTFFTYTRQGKEASLPYMSVPSESLSSHDSLAAWLEVALKTAKRVAAKKVSGRRRRS